MNLLTIITTKMMLIVSQSLMFKADTKEIVMLQRIMSIQSSIITNTQAISAINQNI
jgi:hypothetical protein